MHLRKHSLKISLLETQHSTVIEVLDGTKVEKEVVEAINVLIAKMERNSIKVGALRRTYDET